MRRAASNAAKVCKPPVTAVAPDQRKSQSHHPSDIKAVYQPAGNWEEETVGQKKEDNRMPSWEADKPSCLSGNDAAMERLPRSM